LSVPYRPQPNLRRWILPAALVVAALFAGGIVWAIVRPPDRCQGDVVTGVQGLRVEGHPHRLVFPCEQGGVTTVTQ
jgi:hypothetical protein